MVSFADVGKMWGISIKFRLLHNQLKVARGEFKTCTYVRLKQAQMVKAELFDEVAKA